MKDLNREQLARHLFDVMHKGQWPTLDPNSITVGAKSYWDFLVEHGWHKGYLRLADEIISKGYKP